MHALWGLIKKETYHILRDRQTLTILLVIPLAQVLLFGYAIRTDIKGVRIAVVDASPDVRTRAVRDRLDASTHLEIAQVLRSTEPLEDLFATGRIDQAVVFEPDFAQALGQGSTAHVLVITDAASPNTGTTIQSYTTRVLRSYEQSLKRVSVRGRPAARPVRIMPAVRMRFNSTMESANLFVPGLLAFVLTIISALMTSISIVREKETGTMEELLVSPLRREQIILGKVLPYLALAFINVLSVLAAARLAFGIPLRGSLLLLLAECFLFVIVSLALGVLISTRTASQRTAMMGALIGLMLPTAVLSGMIFPIESMPGWLQPVTTLVPARWFILIVHGVMLKGVGLVYLWQETLVLAGMAAVLLTASTLSFNEHLS